MKSNLRNEIKSYIVRQGMTMQEVVDLLRDEHGWSDSVSNLSNKLQRESLRYTEAAQLADAVRFCQVLAQARQVYFMLRHENRFRPGGHAGVQGDEAGVAAHNFDDGNPFMR